MRGREGGIILANCRMSSRLPVKRVTHYLRTCVLPSFPPPPLPTPLYRLLSMYVLPHVRGSQAMSHPLRISPCRSSFPLPYRLPHRRKRSVYRPPYPWGLGLRTVSGIGTSNSSSKGAGRQCARPAHLSGTRRTGSSGQPCLRAGEGEGESWTRRNRQ